LRNPFRTEPAVAADADLKTAYERGRQQERRRLAGRRHPVLGLIAILIVLAVAWFIYLAIQSGSFTGAGAVVDSKIDQTEHQVNAPLKGAALRTGDALQRAGQSLK